MKILAILGDITDKQISGIIIKLCEQLKPSYMSPDEFIFLENSGLLLLESDNLQKVECNSPIIILKERFIPQTLTLPKDAIVISSSQNIAHLDFLRKLSVNTVTCGFLSKDTVTFSSFTDDSAIISVQGSITCKNFELSPIELPVSFSATPDKYSLMSALTAVLLIKKHDGKSKLAL